MNPFSRHGNKKFCRDDEIHVLHVADARDEEPFLLEDALLVTFPAGVEFVLLVCQSIGG